MLAVFGVVLRGESDSVAAVEWGRTRTHVLAELDDIQPAANEREADWESGRTWRLNLVRRLRITVLIAIVASCGGTADAPTPTARPDVLEPGEQAVNDCERAILAQHEYVGLDDESGRLQGIVYSTCTFAEFSAFNEKVTEPYRYPGNGQENTDYNCRRALSAYKNSLLCTTSE